MPERAFIRVSEAGNVAGAALGFGVCKACSLMHNGNNENKSIAGNPSQSLSLFLSGRSLSAIWLALTRHVFASLSLVESP